MSLRPRITHAPCVTPTQNRFVKVLEIGRTLTVQEESRLLAQQEEEQKKTFMDKLSRNKYSQTYWNGLMKHLTGTEKYAVVQLYAKFLDIIQANPDVTKDNSALSFDQLREKLVNMKSVLKKLQSIINEAEELGLELDTLS